MRRRTGYDPGLAISRRHSRVRSLEIETKSCGCISARVRISIGVLQADGDAADAGLDKIAGDRAYRRLIEGPPVHRPWPCRP